MKKRAASNSVNTSPSEDARLRKGEQTRAIILDATAKLLANNSAHGMAISDVVKATGVPASSIYWHFGSKEGLISAVIETNARRMHQQFPDASHLRRLDDKTAGDAVALFADVLRREFPFIRLLLKLGLEMSDEDNPVANIVRRTRAEAISLGVQGLLPMFSSMPPDRAALTASRIVRQLMTIADGIVINISIEKDLSTASTALDSIRDFIVFLIQREQEAYARARG